MNTPVARAQVVNLAGQRVGTATHLAIGPGLDVALVGQRGARLRAMAGLRKRVPRVTGCAVVVGALLAPMADAASAPVITDGPTVTGEPRVAVELRAQAAWTGDPAPTAEWAWLRCARPIGNCDAIPDATGERYRVRPEDLGVVLRVRLRVSNSSGTAQRRSGPTGIVLAALRRPDAGPEPRRRTDAHGHADRDPRADARGPGESSTPRRPFRRPCRSPRRSWSP